MRSVHGREIQTLHLGVTSTMLAVACMGCNPSPFKIVPVSGVVSLDGQPLAGGIVNFQPVVVGSSGVNAGPGSTARSGTDGRYTLATIRGEPGAVAGKHRVRIFSYTADGAKRSANGGAEREKVPLRYNHESKLTFDVPTAGTDKADFELNTK